MKLVKGLKKRPAALRWVIAFTTLTALLSHFFDAVPAAAGVAFTLPHTRLPDAEATSVTLSVVPEILNVSEGDTFSINIAIDTAISSRGAEFALTFDPTVIECLDVTEGTFYGDWASAHSGSTEMQPGPVIDNAQGNVSDTGVVIVGGDSSGQVGSGTLANCTFRAINAGTSAVTLSNVYVSDAVGNSIGGVTVSDGQITVAADDTNPDTAPPVMETGTASGVSAGSAILNGRLSSPGSATAVGVFFEWGLTATYGNTTPPVTKNSAGAYNVTLDGLLPETTYHYRAVGTGDGTGYGLDATFTTSGTSAGEWDINGDGKCSILDVVKIGLKWGQHGTPGWIAEDVNLDGVINIGDVVLLGLHWDNSGSDPPVTPIVGTTISISPSIQTVAPGSEFDIAVAISTDEECGGAQVALSFNPQVLRCDNYQEGTFFSNWVEKWPNASVETHTEPLAVIDNSNGTVSDFGISLLGATEGLGENGPSGTGIICTYHFTAIGAGSSEITLTGVSAIGFLVYPLQVITCDITGIDVNNGQVVVSESTNVPISPSVSTTSADSITTTSAKLNGYLTGKGTAPSVSVYFEYGTSASYGSMTTAQTRTTAGGFSTTVNNLSPNTTYQFRAKASGAGTVSGNDLTFTTSSTTTALGVSTDYASSVTSTSATLKGNLNGKGAATSVTVSFEYGTTTNYGSATAVQTKSDTGLFSFNLSGLTPNTTYYFRAKAVGTGTVFGDRLSFKTLAAGEMPPSVETKSATNITYYSATLNGNLISRGTANSVKFQFEYGTSASYGSSTTWINKIDTGLFSTGAELDNFKPNTTYHYRAKVQSQYGNDYGSDMTFTTLASSANTIRMSPASQTIPPGTAFDINVILNTSSVTSGSQVGIKFNPSVLRCDGVTQGTFYKNWAEANSFSTLQYPTDPDIDNSSGKVGAIMVFIPQTTSGPSGTGTVFVYRFTAIAAGTSTISFVDVEVSKPSSALIPGISENGATVTVDNNAPTPSPTPDASPTATPGSTPDSNTATPTGTAGNSPSSTSPADNQNATGSGNYSATFLPAAVLTIDLSDKLDGDGYLTSDVLYENFGTIKIFEVKAATAALDSNRTPVKTIEISPVTEPPAPSGSHNRIGLAYSFGPSGATFSNPVTIMMEYNPEVCPPDAGENDLVIAYYDPAKLEWVELESVVDIRNHTITATTTHFTLFAPLVRTAQPVGWWSIGTIIGTEVIVGLISFVAVVYIKRRRASDNKKGPGEYIVKEDEVYS